MDPYKTLRFDQKGLAIAKGHELDTVVCNSVCEEVSSNSAQGLIPRWFML